jgi:hypothetical protein
MSVALPAQCQNPKCKAIFPSGFYTDGKNNSFVGNASQCPVCGSRATVVDGTFSVRDNILEIISAPASSRDMLRAFLSIAEKAKEGVISKEDAISEAGHINPQYAGILQAAFSHGMPILILLITILQTTLQYEGNVSSSQDMKKLLDAVTAETMVLQDNPNKQSVSAISSAPTKPEPTTKPSLVKRHSNRRAEVNERRRHQLKERRTLLGRSRTH